MINLFSSFEEAIDVVKKGGVIVAPTDTLYGLIGDATSPNTVERVYRLKDRTPTKPVILLIPSVEYLGLFGIKPSKKEKKLLEHKGITVVLDLPDEKIKEFAYLHRGTGSLAFRIPNDKQLLNFLNRVGKPVVAPSANPEGKIPATDINRAIEYFGESVDGYIKGEKIKKVVPSTILKIERELKVIREGSIPVDKIKKLLENEQV